MQDQNVHGAPTTESLTQEHLALITEMATIIRAQNGNRHGDINEVLKRAEAVIDNGARGDTDLAAAHSKDAARWTAVEKGDSSLTLRLHNSRPDLRASVVDAYIEESTRSSLHTGA